MKTVFVLAGLLLVQLVWTSPAQKTCEEVFSSNVCAEYESAGVELSDFPPPPPGGNGGNGEGIEKQLLEKLLLEKLNFLTRIGLFKNIPFLGQLVHDMVEKDPEGVSRALSGGIFAVLGLAIQALRIGALGR